MTGHITIRKPDAWHLHVRDGAMFKASLPFTARNGGRVARCISRSRVLTCTDPGLSAAIAQRCKRKRPQT